MHARFTGWTKAVSLALMLAAQGCATGGGEGEGDAEDLATHYTLRLGETKRYEKPLPSRSTILVDWHMASGGVKTVEGFRGWDFNDDGRFEMVEVLDEGGSVQNRLYDFDADGQVDLLKAHDL